MRKILSLLFLVVSVATHSQNTSTEEGRATITVSGIVSDNVGPLDGVAISEKGTNNATTSDTKGRYTISAKIGSILKFNHIGKTPVLKVVSKKPILNVILLNKNERLEEVRISTEGKSSVEVVNTGNQKVDKRKLGYAVESISAEDISQVDTDVQQAVKGQFSGLSIQNDAAQADVDLSQFLGRGRNMSILLSQYGLIVIDGVPISQTDVSPISGLGANSPRAKGISNHINPDNIASITYLKGLAATNKYGTLGRNGVLLITSKTATVLPSDVTSKKKKTIKLGTTPTYLGDSFQPNSLLANTPYIDQLEKSKTIEEAILIYNELLLENDDSPSFLLNTASYFTTWKNPQLIEKILDRMTEFPRLGIEDKLAWAYLYEKTGLHNKATLVYEDLLQNHPNVRQAGRNLALALQNSGAYQNALERYLKIDAQDSNAEIPALEKATTAEFKNLIALHPSEINSNKIAEKYKNNVLYEKRIVFEWNEFDAEFDLQIVNPQNRFFTWSHTKSAESQRLMQEKHFGYGIEEFFLTKDDKGEWLFNITYLGKLQGDNSKPTYLKITTYSDFGKANERQEVKVVTLDELGKKVTILAIKI